MMHHWYSSATKHNVRCEPGSSITVTRRLIHTDEVHLWKLGLGHIWRVLLLLLVFVPIIIIIALPHSSFWKTESIHSNSIDECVNQFGVHHSIFISLISNDPPRNPSFTIQFTISVCMAHPMKILRIPLISAFHAIFTTLAFLIFPKIQFGYYFLIPNIGAYETILGTPGKNIPITSEAIVCMKVDKLYIQWFGTGSSTLNVQFASMLPLYHKVCLRLFW